MNENEQMEDKVIKKINYNRKKHTSERKNGRRRGRDTKVYGIK